MAEDGRFLPRPGAVAMDGHSPRAVGPALGAQEILIPAYPGESDHLFGIR